MVEGQKIRNAVAIFRKTVVVLQKLEGFRKLKQRTVRHMARKGCGKRDKG
jgi:hypothetical protein